jgi:hypothetical protein
MTSSSPVCRENIISKPFASTCWLTKDGLMLGLTLLIKLVSHIDFLHIDFACLLSGLLNSCSAQLEIMEIINEMYAWRWLLWRVSYCRSQSILIISSVSRYSNCWSKQISSFSIHQICCRYCQSHTGAMIYNVINPFDFTRRIFPSGKMNIIHNGMPDLRVNMLNSGSTSDGLL